ncbi:MAG: hypothetical protein ABSC21_04965 [Terriglobia bacterium]
MPGSAELPLQLGDGPLGERDLARHLPRARAAGYIATYYFLPAVLLREPSLRARFYKPLRVA